jgi:hypothetical protein
MSRAQETLKRIEELANADIPDGWERVDQVGTTAFMQRVLTYGSIVGAIFCAIIGFTVFNFDPLQELKTLSTIYGKHLVFGTIVGSIIVMLPIHEAIHILFHPDHGCTQRTIVGFTFVSMFVMYLDQMSINRFLVMLLAPVTIIGATIITFALMMEQFFVIAAILFVVNIGTSLGDLTMAKRVSKIRKNHSKIWNRGTHFIAMKRPLQA